ncbi:hypothetical protein VHEMI10232 [[Torrubiella] hemipterigena]|uniref:Mitochondrial outer membrane protein (Sam35) n=1 Tax=[Torrubiella] hemipterigena TaxID=1531966 RepID=A0A0A1TIB3_9HYPO|nr:hypothetical protein VHEMI10232 [[Torrubiella] hemipterigena]
MTTTTTPRPSRGIFTAPSHIRALFKSFPLQTLPANTLPSRAATSTTTTLPRLFIFARDDAAADSGTPSFNPSCLKYQTLLRIAGVPVSLVPSSNHASPSGSLPFLIPTSSSSTTPLTGTKIADFANIAPDHPKVALYQSVIAHKIRPAWLHTLYLAPANDAVLTALYLPSAALLRATQRAGLHEAATAEILKITRRTGGIDAAVLRENLVDALETLSELLGQDNWFFGADEPGMLDAELFSYTYLILDDAMQWKDLVLAEAVLQFENIVRHRDRLYARCWGKEY